MTYQPSRRRFLMQLGAAAAAGASTPLWLDVLQRGGLPFAWGLGESDVLAAGSPICVHIAMDGGNDYLNTLVPVEDAWYRDSVTGHGPIALTPADTLALAGSTYRLHNNLPWIADRWNTAGDVGFALGVGNGGRNFSHFDSIHYWTTGRLDTLGKTGWLGRYADAVRPQNPLASVSLSDMRLDAVGSTASTLVVQECSTFSYGVPWLSSNVYLNGAKQMATITGTSKIAEVAEMMGTTFQVTERIKAADDPARTGEASNYDNLSALAKQMVQAALLIKAGLPSQSYTMGFGTFDTHTDQKAMQSERFAELNQALTQFFGVLAGHARERDVFVVITSEFGRQATANKDNGTDHGQAGMAMFIGSGVARGIYGQAPTLDPGGPTRPNRIYDALRPTVDFRSVHATVLTRLAKGDANVAEEVLGGRYEDLGMFGGTTPPSTTSTTAAPPTTTSTTLANKKPVPAMTLSKTTGPVPLTITADASGSKDPDGTIVAYRWGWGDGTAGSFTKTATHKFTRRGTFTVRLTVKDNKGALASVTKRVKVT